MASYFDDARQVALDILKPSQKDLERGLEIHRESLVFESYSLGFRAPIDASIANFTLDSGASPQEMKDLLGNQNIVGWMRSEALRAELQDATEASGVSCLCINAGEEGNDPLQLIQRLACYTYLIDSLPGTFVKASSPTSISAAKKLGKLAICLTTNGVPLRGRQISVEDEIGLIKTFAQLGVRMMHLTYNRRNLMGDGCAERANGGLSDFGNTVVAEMNRCGVIVDLAHSGSQTCIDAAKSSSQPVVVSHATAKGIFDHFRAKSDEVIKAVVDSGGALGVTNVPVFLGGSGDISMLLNHIGYIVKKFGDDAVMIGTDAPYVARQAIKERSKIKPMAKTRARWEGLWPEDFQASKYDFATPRRVLSLAWTNWPLFTVGLVQRGYKDETIKKIIGGNMMRVARSTWEHAVILN